MQRLQERLGYRFRDRELLHTALVHRSHANEQRRHQATNERLEFLGDAVLTFVVADRLYRRFTRATEGQLTRARANLVNRRTLARLARGLELNEAVLMGKGARAEGGALLDSILADTFEALLGAAYLDGGIEACNAILERCLAGDELLSEGGKLGDKDPKSRLQEVTQARYKRTPTYSVLSGPPEEAGFRIEVRLGERSLGTGSGASKGEAERAAADQALTALQGGQEQPVL